MLPIVIYETLISLFNFYHDGQIQQGMSYQKNLYKLSRTYDLSQRLQAYALGYDLSQQHQGVIVITVSKQHYKVWIDLRSRSPDSSLSLKHSTEIARIPTYNSLQSSSIVV